MRSAIQNDITPQSASLWMVGRAERLAVFQHRARRDDGATPRHWLDYRAPFSQWSERLGKKSPAVKRRKFPRIFFAGHESASGPERRFAATQRYVRSWSTSRHGTDIREFVAATSSRPACRQRSAQQVRQLNDVGPMCRAGNRSPGTLTCAKLGRLCGRRSASFPPPPLRADAHAFAQAPAPERGAFFVATIRPR